MLLERLCEFSKRLDLPPAMYLSTPIRWLIDLEPDGRLVNFISTPGQERRGDRGVPRLAPHMGRTVGVEAKLLADNAEYVLGIARDPSKQRRVDRCHAAFVALLRDCAEHTQDTSVRAVLRFLETLDPARLTLPAGFDAAHVLTFRVAGVLPIDLPAVREYWAGAAAGDAKEREHGLNPMACLVCGQERPLAGNIPIKIKRIPGGQTAGMALVSTNAVAFESYALDAISCAPICRVCGEQFSNAANALIEGEDTHITIGPLVYLFWTRGEVEFRPGKMIKEPKPEQVKALYAAAWKADPTQIEQDPNKFYATAFSASGARVVVRDWLETTVPAAQRHLARYFALQALVQQDGSESKPIGLYALAASTVRDVHKDLAATVPRAVLRLALTGGPLPQWLLYQAVRRNRAEQRVTRPRAALIKMVLMSQLPELPQSEILPMTQLEPANQDPAYLCGRLLAVLERVQHTALPSAKAIITDRFFGTASSAPASVFGRLLRGAQAHLGKLRKEKPAAHAALQRRLEDVQEKLNGFPKTLTLQEQGLFSLGYYHQRAQDRAEAAQRKRAKGANKKSAATSTN
jgi:CRISPR-associated protein Csd1